MNKKSSGNSQDGVLSDLFISPHIILRNTSAKIQKKKKKKNYFSTGNSREK